MLSTMRTLEGMVRLVSALQLEKLEPMYSSPSFRVTQVRLSIQETAPLLSARSVSGMVSEVISLCPPEAFNSRALTS